jgi:sulfatase modifying factor 1
MRRGALLALGVIMALLTGAVSPPHGKQTRHPVGSTFRDCAGCPEMVVIPAGRFKMGSPPDEPGRDLRGAEDPQHWVSIPRPFAVGKYEVLRDEWAMFVAETGQPDPPGCNIHQPKPPQWPTIKGLNWHNTGFSQTGRDPAVCMSWNEAKAFTKWLSAKTGKRYRLLSEAEWEYAARAGTATAHPWGERPEDACLYANGSDLTRHNQYPEWPVDQPCTDGFAFTAPAGSFRPNAFGLYDMLGNVAEMTEDCLYFSYGGAPTDGSARETGNCSRRINRGDTWTSTPGRLRPAARGFDDATLTRVVDLGFRLARDLEP